MKHLLVLYLLLNVGMLYAQPNDREGRRISNINGGWLFSKDNYAEKKSAQWQRIDLPHTWNVDDVMDDEPGYYRAACYYKKILSIGAELKSKEVYLLFEGVNQQAEIFINGKKAGAHNGGYTAFYIAVSKYLDFNDNAENEVIIKVDNSFNKDIPPLTADFTFYGGIYRSVSLVVTNKTHFSLSGYGADALYINTTSVDKNAAAVAVKGTITSNAYAQQELTLNSEIFNAEGSLVGSTNTPLVTRSSSNKNFTQEINKIATPTLWSPEHPYLYTVVTKIIDARSGEVLDKLSNKLGFRWFRFDGEKGFFLNGEPYKLVGASRHQDYQGMGNAVPKDLARKDIELLKVMGGNFLRVAHYPQDKAVMEACDELGILASVEIPIVNEITESNAFYNNCKTMLVEMIRQNYNHPSVIVWCYMNEVLLKPHFRSEPEKQSVYFSNIATLARSLDSLARTEDPSRYTMIANHGDFDRYRKTGLLNIAMITGWNLYQGWYGGTMSDFGSFLDQYHAAYPATPMMVSEYGADADPRINAVNPIRFDKSVEYATAFHKHYLTEMLKRPFVAGAIVWNLADFNSETRQETMPHINNKGLLTWDRQPKQPYYYYQAMLSKIPFIKITPDGKSNSMCNALSFYTSMKVAANLDSVEMLINGQSIGRKKAGKGFTDWTMSLKKGTNTIIAQGNQKGKLYADTAVIEFQPQPVNFKNPNTAFTELNILLGADRYFIGNDGCMWIPDQVYRKDSWGSAGGSLFKIPNNSRLPYGTDSNIIGTLNDPVYQTQRIGIKEYRLDVPAGMYELSLHFAELAGTVADHLVYNLSGDGKSVSKTKRIFSVLVNNVPMLDKFDIGEQYGIARAVIKKIDVKVSGDEGISVLFKPITGEPVLNALQLKKLN